MIYLIGTGQMAVDYTKVLLAQKRNFKVIGRGSSSANNFENQTGIKPITGGIENYIENNEIDRISEFIIATGTEVLMETLKRILVTGARKVLVEKPAAISIDELLQNEDFLKPFFDKVFIAYNRRFYASVIETLKLIEADGGLRTMHFEFTEWAHKIEPLQKAAGVKENWFFVNSTHVIDLAFFIAGMPIDWKCYSNSGQLKWHEKSNFAGAGITNKCVLFSYISNWESAGRWSLELFTDKRRIYLKPFEDLNIQNRGGIEIGKYDIDDSLDIQFKPGLFLQVEDFLSPNPTMNLCTLNTHIQKAKLIYSSMLK
ncbi:MAG: gfo/Idh/MocA family oxidoreductase [Candidatus Levybacteria bacterium]|nr:gfo/Idh/MocA family oxidoreductase [Candidatus Levybacteria bacterium]